MSFKNKIGQRENKITYPGWVKGWNEKGVIIKHPYTMNGFKFDLIKDKEPNNEAR